MTIDGASPIPLAHFTTAAVFQAGDRVILRYYRSEADPRRNAEGEVVRVHADGSCDVAAAIVGIGLTELRGLRANNLQRAPTEA